VVAAIPPNNGLPSEASVMLNLPVMALMAMGAPSLVGEARPLGLLCVAISDERKALRIAILFGFFRESVQFGTCLSISAPSVDMEGFVPLRERNTKRLAKNWREEKEQRGDNAGRDYGESGFAHGALLGKKIAAGRNCRAVSIWKNQCH